MKISVRNLFLRHFNFLKFQSKSIDNRQPALKTTVKWKLQLKRTWFSKQSQKLWYNLIHLDLILENIFSFYVLYFLKLIKKKRSKSPRRCMMVNLVTDLITCFLKSLDGRQEFLLKLPFILIYYCKKNSSEEKPVKIWVKKIKWTFHVKLVPQIGSEVILSSVGASSSSQAGSQVGEAYFLQW